MGIKSFQNHILDWYGRNRRDLPWRPAVRWTKNRPLSSRSLPKNLTPYHIFLSEIMLQQTQVSRVLRAYPAFLAAFPSWKELAEAPTEKLFSAWSGMGYWRRALFLRDCAKNILQNWNGNLPQNPEILRRLPGVGPYTAGAVACFAFQNSEPFMDTNIRRVFIRFFFQKRKKVNDKEISPLARQSVWLPNPREWNYALMDYGSLVLGAERALNRKSAHYHRQSSFRGSFRHYRTAIVRLLIAGKSMPERNIREHLLAQKGFMESGFSTSQILRALQKDNIVRHTRRAWRLV